MIEEKLVLCVVGFKEYGLYAEQKVKVPSRYCDARVQTVCADVMKLPEHQARALSPQVQYYICVC